MNVAICIKNVIIKCDEFNSLSNDVTIIYIFCIIYICSKNFLLNIPFSYEKKYYTVVKNGRVFEMFKRCFSLLWLFRENVTFKCSLNHEHPDTMLQNVP